MSKDVLASRPLPPDTSVVVSKEGDKPANITVKRGDKKWEVTEKQLDKLPADVRPFVEQMLGRGAMGIFGGLKAYDVTPGACAWHAARGRQFSASRAAAGNDADQPCPPPARWRSGSRSDSMRWTAASRSCCGRSRNSARATDSRRPTPNEGK